jgi:two-component system NtrC family sensor kinase
MRVESAPGQGAVFAIDLPVERRRETRPEVASASTEPLIRGKTILVVDDEPEVAEILRELLSQDDHSVDTATDGAVALEKISARAYDAILSDNRMPGLDGPSLYRQLQRRHPELLSRMILVTGDVLTPSTQDFLLRTRVPTLYKPFDLERARQVVQRVLGAAGAVGRGQ